MGRGNCQPKAPSSFSFVVLRCCEDTVLEACNLEFGAIDSSRIRKRRYKRHWQPSVKGFVRTAVPWCFCAARPRFWMRGKAGRAPSTDGFVNRQENSSKLQPAFFRNLGAGVGETKLQPSSLRNAASVFHPSSRPLSCPFGIASQTRSPWFPGVGGLHMYQFLRQSF